MNGFLLDENLPSKIQFIPSLPITHVSVQSERRKTMIRSREMSKLK